MFTACGKKAESPVNVKAENETTASSVQTPEDVSSDNGQSTISRDEAVSEESGESYEDYDYSESGYEDYDYSYDDYDYDDYGYDDYGYDDYSYDDGGLYYGDYDDGHGGYLCDYGYYTAEINTEELSQTLASINVYNSNGQMTAEVCIFDINEDRDTFFCTVYAAAEDSFGHASRDTEVEMNVSCLDSDNCYCYNGDATGGSFTATVYWPSSKCYFKLTCGNGTVYEYTCYP